MFRRSDSCIRRAPTSLLLLVVLATVFAAASVAREVVPTPPGGGVGINNLTADQQNPREIPAPGPEWRDRSQPDQDVPCDLRVGDLGGDDVEVDTFTDSYDDDLAIASNGDLFAVFWYEVDDDNNYRFTVRRSDDGGTTWRDWASFYDPTPGYRYWDPVIHIAEGDEDRCFVAYAFDPGVGRRTEVHVAWSPLDLENGDFSNDTVIHTSSYGAVSPSLTTDDESFSQYYVYLSFSADDGNGHDIHFVRSVDQGTTWEAPYVIGAITVDDRGYYRPHVAVGYGGYVHVVWFLGFAVDHEYDDTLRYRRAPNYAGGGLANWENTQSLSSHLNDVDEWQCTIDASVVSPDVMIACERRLRNPTTFDGVGTLSSADGGATWSGITEIGSGLVRLGDVIHQETNGRWLMGLDDGPSWGFRWAPVASPSNWSDLQVFSDDNYTSDEPEIILDPTHDDRIGIIGANDNPDDSNTYYFDAEWRADPGYPNFEAGFPVDLAAEPASDPALVDLDGDGFLEIVFGDDAGDIQVFRHDGTPLPGWPVEVGTALSDSPVAIGDLNGDGQLSVVAGSLDGRVFAYNAAGTLMDGWPVYIGVEAPLYVAIGAVGGPYPRAVVAGAGGVLTFRDWHGEYYPGSVNRGWNERTISAPPAIGDIDGDGRNEVVVAASHSVYAFPMDGYGWDIFLDLEADVTGGVTLGDFDQDGDVEVVVPLANGTVHLLEGDGSEFPGAWPVAAAASEINGAAIANCLGGSEPEIMITARNWQVSLLWFDGGVGAGWPQNPANWYIYGKPIMGRVDGTTSDVIVGARGQKGWAWNNFGGLIPGWPKTFEDHIYRTPAYGDLDLDGNAEIVFLSSNQLAVVDIGIAPGADLTTWAMAGHDHQRTGCSDCVEDVVGVEDDAVTGVTRVSMAAPWPNPITNQALFSFAVPVRARVELSIYDVRGRRVATVNREEREAGRHMISWNGRDGDGRPLASGQYVASLRVRGPGVDETVTRKVTVLR